MSRELRRRTVDWAKPLPLIRSDADFNQFTNGEPLSSEEDVQIHPSSPMEVRRKKRPPKEIFVPNAASQTIDLKDLGLDPGDYSRPSRIRWRSAALATDAVTHNTSREDDPLGPDVHYILTLRDEEILSEINLHKIVLSQKDFQKAFDTWEKATGTNKQLIDHAKAIDLVHQRGLLDLPAYVLNEVYAAWCRRREDSQKPILRMFWPIGQSGEDPPTSSFSTFKISSSRWRLRRPRRNTEQLLARARELHKECMSVLRFANTIYTGERLKRQKILGKQCVASLQAKRKDHALILHELRQDVVCFRDEQKGIASREELLAHAADPTVLAQQPARSTANKRKMVYVLDGEEKSNGGGMLGQLAANRRAAQTAEGDSDSPKQQNRLRMRMRQGRSNRWYIDRVAEAEAPHLERLPTFAQFHSFEGFDASGGLGDSETRSNEYADSFLDEIHETLKAVKLAVATDAGAAGEEDPSTSAALAASLSTDLTMAYQAYQKLTSLAHEGKSLVGRHDGGMSVMANVSGRTHSTAI
jgi:hypothetical protein